MPGPSTQEKKIDHSSFDPIKAIREEKHLSIEKPKEMEAEESETVVEETKMEVEECEPDAKNSNSSFTQEILERRLKIEEEVSFVSFCFN